jgi:threonine synthase
VLIMTFYSTKNPSFRVDFRRAVLEGLPPDNGLYMPVEIPDLPDAFWQNLGEYGFPDLAFRMAENLLRGSLPSRELEDIVHRAVNFPAPLRQLGSGIWVLELFHGPSMAFKDFGARFMAEVMSYLNRGEDRELTVLVATSGDTGGAVAAGFHGVPGMRVVILYPSGKVSPLQEKQLTTWGDNVQALEISGTFDDCQAMVKEAFLDAELRRRMRLTSANSINIARLIPQSFYYAEGYK